MRNVTTTVIVGILILLSGCTKDNVQTAPLDNIVIKEVAVPIAACPKEVDKVVFPVRPHLAVDDLTPADNKNFNKVGKAYMKSLADLKEYSEQLEKTARGVKDICHAVNTPLSGKQQ